MFKMEDDGWEYGVGSGYYSESGMVGRIFVVFAVFLSLFVNIITCW